MCGFTSSSARKQRAQGLCALFTTTASTLFPSSGALFTVALAQRKKSASCDAYFFAIAPASPAMASGDKMSSTSASVALPKIFAVRCSSSRPFTAVPVEPAVSGADQEPDHLSSDASQPAEEAAPGQRRLRRD